MLFELAKLFPTDPSLWEIEHPSRALGQELRSRIRRRFGDLQTAQDIARPRVPDRLGISLRPYESGDPVRTLSLSHFFKANELQTRTDFAPGRRNALVLMHIYENMQFRSNDVPAAKGQVALALAGVIQAVHDALGQSCRVVPVRDWDIDKAVTSVSASVGRAHHLYVVSDLLFDASDREACVARMRNAMLQAHFASGFLMVVRDALEHPDENRLGVRSASLRPFAGSVAQTTPELFSGLHYARNLRRQRESVEALASDFGLAFSLLHGGDTVERVIDELVSFIGGRGPSR